MRLPSLPAALALLLVHSASGALRPPAVPLVAHDPYLSVWSFSNRLADEDTRHWTGAQQPLSSLVRIDGITYRLMGKSPQVASALPQTAVRVLPTRTVYAFAGAGVQVLLTFTTPSLPDDLDVLSRPATYLTWEIRSTDRKPHQAQVYFSADARLAVNEPSQTVTYDRAKVGNLSALRIGSVEQPVLQKRGDDLRIDWGHLYVAAPGRGYVGLASASVAQFEKGGVLPAADAPSKARPAKENVAAAFALPFGKVGVKPIAKHLILAYDDEYSIQFMGHNLRPYWRRHGLDARGLLAIAERDYAALSARCLTFDHALEADLTKAGGADYATLGALAYRQSFAAQKLVADAKGQPLMFSKENFSNGCISTVDVLYPAAPQLLLFSPALTRASLTPILQYSASSRWRWPFAPHDLGQYPKANGQVYGGGEQSVENQMPVEESGNMLLLLAALAKVEGSAKFSAPYWPQLSRWAGYLAKEGFDPASQLSTDDFAGHLAHNVNLSAKAIEALGAYAYLAEKLGKRAEATKYHALAQSFAKRWVKEAADGDHYKLAFDKEGTWSQKYNLVWDRILGLNLFPTSVARTEMAFYRTKMNPFGLPLDSRADYTKLDWQIWTATLTGNRADFESLVSPILRFLNATPDRAPMGDFYYTSRPKKEGFQARSVVGGVFIKMLDTPAWTKYARRAPVVKGPWAPLPKPPVVTEIVPTALKASATWAYTFDKPARDWYKPGFDAFSWRTGAGAFGDGENRGGILRTPWTSDDIWLRREFDLKPSTFSTVQLSLHHDDGAEVYINGVLVVDLPGAAGYETYELPKAVRATLKPTHNVLAIHCHNDGGPQYIDAGFVTTRLR